MAEDACSSAAKAVASSLCEDVVLAGRLLPLEILPAGQFDPVYRLPISVSGGVSSQSCVPENESLEDSSSMQSLLCEGKVCGVCSFKRCLRSVLPVPGRSSH